MNTPRATTRRGCCRRGGGVWGLQRRRGTGTCTARSHRPAGCRGERGARPGPCNAQQRPAASIAVACSDGPSSCVQARHGLRPKHECQTLADYRQRYACYRCACCERHEGKRRVQPAATRDVAAGVPSVHSCLLLSPSRLWSGTQDRPGAAGAAPPRAHDCCERRSRGDPAVALLTHPFIQRCCSGMHMRHPPRTALFPLSNDSPGLRGRQRCRGAAGTMWCVCQIGLPLGALRPAACLRGDAKSPRRPLCR